MKYKYLDMIKVINPDNFYFDPKGIVNAGCVVGYKMEDNKFVWEVAMFNGVNGKFQQRAWFNEKELKLDKIEQPKKEEKN